MEPIANVVRLQLLNFAKHENLSPGCRAVYARSLPTYFLDRSLQYSSSEFLNYMAMRLIKTHWQGVAIPFDHPNLHGNFCVLSQSPAAQFRRQLELDKRFFWCIIESVDSGQRRHAICGNKVRRWGSGPASAVWTGTTAFMRRVRGQSSLNCNIKRRLF